MTSSISQEKPDRVDVDTEQVQEIYNNYGVSLPDLEQALVECLQERGWEQYEDTEKFRDELQRAFEDAYLQETGKIVIPEALDIAAKDATHWIKNRRCSTNGSSSDQLAPTFTALVGAVLPEYSRRGLDPHGSVQFLHSNDGTQPSPN